MKTLVSKILVAFIAITTMTSCAVDLFNRIEGNRHVVTEQRKLNDDFSQVKVSTGLDLYITQGDKVSLTVKADENLHDIIITEVNNGQLRIYAEKGIRRAKARKVYLTVTNLEELVATSGSDVYSENTLKADFFTVKVSSGADARIKVDADNVESSASSGADLRISGKSKTHSSKASSGSSIYAFRLLSEDVTVRVSSGADINIYASESINARASSGGDIDFKGNPKSTNKKKSSGGSISKY